MVEKENQRKLSDSSCILDINKIGKICGNYDWHGVSHSDSSNENDIAKIMNHIITEAFIVSCRKEGKIKDGQISKGSEKFPVEYAGINSIFLHKMWFRSR